MKLIVLNICKTIISPQLFKNLLNNIDFGLKWVLDIDKNIILINHNKNITFFIKNIINRILQSS